MLGDHSSKSDPVLGRDGRYRLQYVYVRLEPHYINISDSSVDTGACTANYSDPRVQALAELQGAVAEVLLYFSLANTGPMVLTTILLGAYSDVIGRKLLFLLPTAAGLVEFVVTAVIVKLPKAIIIVIVIISIRVTVTIK
nr:hypothetical protein BaRGS_014156 [Batillaria attramentaria]